jgi:hypothetical protein
MSRKDYIAAAHKFADLMEGNSPNSDANFIAGMARGVIDSANAMADVFAADNANFDRARFLKACGL